MDSANDKPDDTFRDMRDTSLVHARHASTADAQERYSLLERFPQPRSSPIGRAAASQVPRQEQYDDKLGASTLEKIS